MWEGLRKFIQRPFDGQLKFNFVWSLVFICSVSTKYCSYYYPFTRWYIINERFWDSEVPWFNSFVLCWIHSLFWGGLDTKFNKPWNNIHIVVHLFNLLWYIRPSSSSVEWIGILVSTSLTKERFQISIITWPQALV